MKIFEKGELKLLWPFYLDTAISTLFMFAAAFIFVYFTDLGLSMFQIGILVSASSLATVLFEIPTGAIADIYGRKFSVLLGCLIQGLGYLIIFFSSNFYNLAFGFFFIGFGVTFSSGAHEAWIVDLVKGNTRLTKSYFVKIQSLVGFTAIFSGILGAWFVKNYGLRLTWMVAAFSFLFSLIILSLAKENFKRKKVQVKKSFIEIKKKTSSSFLYMKNHPVLYYLTLASLIGVFFGLFDSGFVWIPMLKQIGVEDYMFGYLMSAMGVVAFLAPLTGGYLSKKGKERNFIILSLILTSITLLFIVLTNSKAALLVIFFLSFFFSLLSSPIKSVYFQKFSTSKLRATITSTNSMLVSLVSIIAMPIVGYVVDLIGPKHAILFTPLLSIPLIIIYLQIKEPRNQKS